MTLTLDRPAPSTREIVDDLTRRRFVAAGAALTALLAGCGGGEVRRPPIADTRTADTPRGPVTLPADPQRVYAAYFHDLANALVLGLPVVAGPGEYGAPNDTLPAYLTDLFPRSVEVELIPFSPELNHDRIAALGPDVILCSIFGSDATGYDKLDAIAPTVTHHYSTGEKYAVAPWRDVLRQNGSQFGREAEAQRWIAAFEERAAGLRERITSRWAGATWATVEPYPGELAVAGPAAGHVSATLTEELGLAPSPAVERLVAEAGIAAQGSASVSYERLGEITADIIFVPEYVPSGGTSEAAGRALLERNPLWRSLPAVAANRVHTFTQSLTNQSGPTASAFLDVVERTLLA